MATNIERAFAGIGGAPINQQYAKPLLRHPFKQRMAFDQIKDRWRVDQRRHKHQRWPIAAIIAQARAPGLRNDRSQTALRQARRIFKCTDASKYRPRTCSITATFARHQIKKKG